MTDATRPLLLGYIRVHLLMTDNELSDTIERLGYFARCEGYALGTVFTEQVHSVPAAFAALVEAVDRDGAQAIVVPSMQHLAVLGRPPLLSDYLQRVTGVRVLAADAFP
jgi:hypothetical protein